MNYVDYNKIGCLGHSYGGNTTTYLTAFDKRIKYACASGSVVTFRNRIKNNVGIEMASVIPNFMKYYDIDDVVCEICPIKFLIVSATEDKYSKDAMYIYKKAKKECEDFLNKLSNPERSALRYEGINNFEKLASLRKKELLSIHGIGPKSLPIVIECLNNVGMKLRD